MLHLMHFLMYLVDGFGNPDAYPNHIFTLLDDIPMSFHVIGLMCQTLDHRDVPKMLLQAGQWLFLFNRIDVPWPEGGTLVSNAGGGTPPLEYQMVLPLSWGTHPVSFPQMGILTKVRQIAYAHAIFCG